MNLALLVLDVQRGLFEPQPPPADAHAAVQPINPLPANGPAARVPALFV